MRWILLAVFLAILPVRALADQASFRYGLGIIGTATTQVKAFGLRHEEALGLFDAHVAKEVGVWTDTGRAAGRRGSAFGKYQLGVRPESQHVYAHAYWGVAGITGVDSQLGGVLQFATDLGLGFQGQGSYVGINLTHISSAGIWKPNKGRDFLMLELGIRF